MSDDKETEVGAAFQWLVENASMMLFTAKNDGYGNMKIKTVARNGADITANVAMLDRTKVFDRQKFLAEVKWLQEIMA